MDDLSGKRNWVGGSVRRVEDPRHLYGHGCYVADLAGNAGVLHVAFVRSPYAHARIVGVDADAARNADDVVLVVRGSDLRDKQVGLPADSQEQIPSLAHDEVRYVGEPVAAVVAGSRYTAEDAAALITLEYDELPLVLDPQGALEDRVPATSKAPTNVISRVESWPEDLDAVFAVAPMVVSRTFRTQLQTATPLEPRGVVAAYDPGTRQLTIHASTQMPHIYREYVCSLFGLSVPRVRVVAPDVGGAFGVKLAIYPEDIAVIYCALRLGRSVAWISDRYEALLADCQARGAVYTADAAFGHDGRFHALRAEMVFPAGAYAAVPYSGGKSELFIGALSLPGPYKVEHYGYRGAVVLTNTAPTTTYRATGGPGATWVTESLLDDAAIQLELDRAEIRRINMVAEYEFPFTSVCGATYDQGSFIPCLEQALERVGYKSFERERTEAAARGRLRGIGFASYVEPTAYGVAGPEEAPVLPYDPVTIRMEPNGEVSVAVSISSQGQGHATTVAQLVADELRLDLSAVHVRGGDTALSGYGGGTHGSRSIAVAGAAALIAAKRLRHKLLRLAADMLEVAPEDLALEGDSAVVVGAPDRRVAVAELAREAYVLPQRLPADEEPGLEETARFVVPSPYTFTNGCHACVVEIEPSVGRVTVLRYVVVQDCGKIVNPAVVEGQIRGAIAQGIGSAFLEKVTYDETGQPLATTLIDYLLPLATDMPPKFDISHIETPSNLPGGMKGVGEAGLVAAPAALSLAVQDALRHSPGRVSTLPLTPADVAEWVSTSSADGRERLTPRV